MTFEVNLAPEPTNLSALCSLTDTSAPGDTYYDYYDCWMAVEWATRPNPYEGLGIPYPPGEAEPGVDFEPRVIGEPRTVGRAVHLRCSIFGCGRLYIDIPIKSDARREPSERVLLDVQTAECAVFIRGRQKTLGNTNQQCTNPHTTTGSALILNDDLL